MKRAIEQLTDFVSTWWILIASIVGVATFVSGFFSSATPEDPSGGAGVFGGILALCVAAIVFAEKVNPAVTKFRRAPEVCIGVGSVGSAYLLLVGAAGAHPTDPTLPDILGMIWGAAGVTALILAIIAWTIRSSPQTALSKPRTNRMRHRAGSTETARTRKEINRLVAQIIAACSEGAFVFRGEPRRFPAVSSGLYRECADVVEAAMPFAVLEQVERQEARSYLDGLRPDGDEMEVMSAIQHYGGRTNFVDFTADINIALFFGCDGNYSEDGRVILLEKRAGEHQQFYEPEGPDDRAPAQRSIFVIPQNGIVEGYEEIAIPSALKLPLLRHLRQYYGIDHKSVYSGPHGYIKYRQRHWNVLRHEARGIALHNGAEYTDAIKCFNEAITENPMRGEAYRCRGVSHHRNEDHDLAIRDLNYALEIAPYLYPCRVELGDVYVAKREYGKATTCYGEALRHVMPVPDTADCYNRRGIARRYNGDCNEAISDYTEAMSLCQQSAPENAEIMAQLSDVQGRRYREILSKARELYGKALCNRGEAYLHLSDWERANIDLTEADRRGVDVAESFQQDYANIAEFESATGTTVPPELVTILIGNGGDQGRAVGN